MLHYPSYLALAALWHVTGEVAASSGEKACEDVLNYVKHSKFSKNQPFHEVHGRLKEITEAFRLLKSEKNTGGEKVAASRAKQVKLIYKKLKQFHTEEKKDKKKKSVGKDKKRKDGPKDSKMKIKKQKAEKV